MDPRAKRQRRIRKTRVPYTRRTVFTRDKWICQICKMMIPNHPPHPFPHPLSPSIDHIIPLSKGGPDRLENVQMTHLLCNLRKGHKKHTHKPTSAKNKDSRGSKGLKPLKPRLSKRSI